MSAPLNLVNLERVHKAHGTTVILDDVSLGVAAGERIGVVGRNGGGKSTLLGVLTGTQEPDSGRVTRRSDLAMGVLDQTGTLPPGTTVRDVVLPPSRFAAEHEWAGDAAVRSVLTGLELDRIGLDSPVAPMSGGERRRVALAAQLIRPLDLLVLDEPTNHLDVEGVAWLAEYVKARTGGLIVVTHDRWFLDEVSTTTWEVADGSVHAYEGGYSAYTLARAERSRIANVTEERRLNLVRKELAWLRRGPPARTSKPKFRIEAAQALIADEPPARDTMALAGFAARRLGKTVYDVEDVTYTVRGRGDDAEDPAGPADPGGPRERTLFHDLTWHVGPGDRIGVVGVNGAGKTSLLKLLVGEAQPDAGRVVVGQTVSAAYLSQHVTELDPRQRVLEAVQDVARIAKIGNQEISASTLAERFGFAANRQWTPVGDLSGGERRRLQLLRLLMAEPNVLLLDEPTNDLDIDTLTALEDLLDSFPGTVLVVSHDRYFVDRVCDSVVALMGDGSLAALPGGVEEYLRRRAAGEAALPGSGAAAPVGSSSAPAHSAADSRAARKEASRLERRMLKLDADEKKLHEQLAAAATDYGRAAELDAQLKALQAEKEQVETDWLAAAEVADA
ncbi:MULTISPECIES: ABC-F family ATP-binding cassette domain-containing protein [unclassified Modestobacter]|uniref:ABC-F family ATP-binding cassette domain-containing protein n=1 Tax=unclassified Modestobacter TaxID=2643866 RepID=UPI0022AB1F64|nr:MULTISPECIES: ABC-F family ATP-binding cassette domain-containing protein [unclassified Modestobacter]MCZ2825476.1 ABC-F family ATP-binding cassette domain-containing protein [Modestobacter sp. VKM Ac-2981]MCZ2853459.1 ABC-F family ATP-binding cassette domain-containing protein [Modestobacter sp. VKM Ac-2982]